MDDITLRIEEEWRSARSGNPYLSREWSPDEVRSQWNEAASEYSGSSYDGSRMMMFADLEAMGLIGPEVTMLDIGCGPGQYDIAFSRYVREIVCLDVSESMLSRLKAECRRAGVTNIRPVVSGWEDYRPDRRFDVVYSSLCPAVYDPESFLRMESMSCGHCVYVTASSRSNDICTGIWEELGTDYRSYGMPVDHPLRFLRSLGREPEVRKYYKNTVVESDPEKLRASLVRYFSRYTEVDERVSELIDSAVDGHTSDGVVREDRHAVMNMMVWSPE